MSSPHRLDRYQIVDQIGKGAMGVVYLAKDPLIGRLVALKTFHLPKGMEEAQVRQARDRFLREAQSAGILSHPNIVTIHDVVEESAEGVTFFAMEYVRGTNLKQMLRSDEELDLPTITDVVWQVAEALQYAHSKGVVHRDIKPANILITSDRRVKLTDFGIARLHRSDLTLHGQLLGTPNYMAPEQVQGKDVDHRADIFSLGVVLYELLTRNKPFAGDHLTVVTHRIVNEAPTPPEEYVGRIPLELSSILDRALAKDPDQRYQRVGELARDLRAVCDAIMSQASLTDTQEIELPEEEPPPAPEPKAGWQERVGAAGGALSAAVGRAGAGARAVGEKLRSSENPMLAKVGSAFEAVSLKRLALVAGAAALLTVAAFWLLLSAVRPEAGEPVDDGELATEYAYLEPLRAGHRQMQEGDPAGAIDSFVEALYHAPPERKEALEELRLAAESRADAEAARVQLVADLETTLESARQALEAGSLDRALEEAGRVLALEPSNATAQEILAAAQAEDQRLEAQRQERLRLAEERRRQEQEQQLARPAPRPAPSPVAAVEPPPKPAEPTGPVQLTVDFYSQVSQGVLTVYAGGSQLLREAFRFTERANFFRSKKVPGGFVRTIELPPGPVELKIYVALDRTRSETVRSELVPGSVANLEVRVDEGGNLSVNLR